MADSHKLFIHFNDIVKLTDDKRKILLSVRNKLRERIQINFNKINSQDRRHLEIYFQTQGSFIMDTIIRPLNDDYDLDDGVYFQGKESIEQRPEPQTFHTWIVNAVDQDNVFEDVQDRHACVRVQYKKDFHIDIPIYYADNIDSPDLAEIKEGWILSNPIEFIAWFEGKAQSGFKKAFLYERLEFAEPYKKWLTDIRKQDAQLRRLVRYMKAWADLKRKEMPCGIIMTILVAENFAIDTRDDIAFKVTLEKIKQYLLNNGIKCLRPTSPKGEDLLASTNKESKEYFMTALDNLIVSANRALNAPNEKEACKEWAKHFGSRFPCHLAKENGVPTILKSPNIESLKRTAAVSTPWYQQKKY